MHEETAVVFDVMERTDRTASRYSEPAFTFLNRRAGDAWSRVRELVEGWFSRVPDGARPDLRSRLRSTSNKVFYAAFFELYCHEMLRRSGWDLEPHPHLQQANQRPDFCARRGDKAFYLEASAIGLPIADEGAEKRVNSIIDEINDRLPIGDFMVGVMVINIGANTPRVSRLCRELGDWLAALDADSLLSAGGADQFVSMDWSDEEWRLSLDAIPLAPAHRGPGGRIVGTHGHGEAMIIDDTAPIRARVAKKAKKYGELDTGLVIAIDSGSPFVQDHDLVDALYGTHAIRYYVDAGPGGPPPRWVRQPDGLIAGPEGWRRRQVSAILSTASLTPWTVARVIPTWWIHPGALYPIETAPPIVREARLDLVTREIAYSQGPVEPHEFFELSENWPNFDPDE